LDRRRTRYQRRTRLIAATSLYRRQAAACQPDGADLERCAGSKAYPARRCLP